MRTIYDPVDAVDTHRFCAGVYDPSWSPDDKWILVEKPVEFSGDGENGGAGVWHILKIDVSSTSVEDLTMSGEHAASALYLPSFSPDGEWIVFSARYGPQDPSQVSLEIVKMSEDGSSVHLLTSTNYWEQFPVWIR